MQNVTYRKHLNVHNICKSTKKKFATENSDVALFLYSSCKKTEKIRGSLVIVAFFPLKEEQKL